MERIKQLFNNKSYSFQPLTAIFSTKVSFAYMIQEPFYELKNIYMKHSIVRSVPCFEPLPRFIDPGSCCFLHPAVKVQFIGIYWRLSDSVIRWAYIVERGRRKRDTWPILINTENDLLDYYTTQDLCYTEICLHYSCSVRSMHEDNSRGMISSKTY